MTHEKLNEIKTKIVKLLAKAESTDNEHERDLFMNKVNELLLEHQIEMHEIRMHAGNSFDADPLGHTEGAWNVYASASWNKIVIHAIAKLYGATTVWHKQRNHMPYKVFGRESARITTELMVPYIISQIRQVAKAYAFDHGYTASVAQRNVGIALASRIYKMIEAADKVREVAQSKALVPVDNLATFVEDFYGGKLKQGRSGKGFKGSASSYAEKISINRQATHETRKQIA